MTNLNNNELSINELDAVAGGDAEIHASFWGVRIGITQTDTGGGGSITCTTIKSGSGTSSSCTIK
jgi:hypothetical protein